MLPPTQRGERRSSTSKLDLVLYRTRLLYTIVYRGIEKDSKANSGSLAVMLTNFVWWGDAESTWYAGHYWGFCTSPGWQMSLEQSVEWQLAGETEVLGENLPQCHFVHHKSYSRFICFCHFIVVVGRNPQLYNIAPMRNSDSRYEMSL
jgi:hypothetical protein